MIGLLLASHGSMAEGMLDSLRLFFRDDMENIQALCVRDGDDPLQFGQQILTAVNQLNDGSGVVIFVDLLGGTPGMQSASLLRDPKIAQSVKIISGMNLGMVMELLANRNSLTSIEQIDPDKLLEAGRDGIQYINKMLGLS